uniref:Uncharacterized protein n=1 Tax=Glossina pallidipes TaxID=7398 RepID=A0A1A9ZW74_GLOPL
MQMEMQFEFNLMTNTRTMTRQRFSEQVLSVATDFGIGHVLRAIVIRKAVLSYTGDIVDDEDEDDDSYDGEEEEDDEESGDEKKHISSGGSKRKLSPNECQQHELQSVK